MILIPFSIAEIAIKEGENIVWSQIAKGIVCYVKAFGFHPHWRTAKL